MRRPPKQSTSAGVKAVRPPSRRALAHAAAELAGIGLAAVPMIAADKRPAVKGWRERVSADPATVRKVFDATSADALAIATGDGVFVIDLDRNHSDGVDGVERFAEMVRANGGELPRGPRVRTPSGGVHCYFASPTGVRVRNRVGLVLGIIDG